MIKLILLITLLLTPLFSQTIEKIWEVSSEYKEYERLVNANQISKAMKLKHVKVNAITKQVLKDYIADFKSKYQENYLEKFYDFPSGLVDLAVEIHQKGKPLLKDQSAQSRHNFVKALYEFLNHYNKEDGKATYYVHRLEKKASGIEGTPFMDILNTMAKQSDSEAAKTPEQKQKEHEEYMKKMQEEIDIWIEIGRRLDSIGS